MSKSLLRKDSKKSRPSTSHQYRVSISPYEHAKPANQSRSRHVNSTLLFSKSKPLTGNAMDRRARRAQTKYNELLKDFTDAQRRDLETVREEIGWGNESSPDEPAIDSMLLEDDDGDSNWSDEPDDIFHAFSVLVARHGSDSHGKKVWMSFATLSSSTTAWDPHNRMQPQRNRHHPPPSLRFLFYAFASLTVYARHLRKRLSDAFDVYLAIVRMIDSRIAKGLGREDPDWRMANACAACTYRLTDDPKFKYSTMFTCDGNNSLKRLANASVVDRRTLNGGYFLSPDYVDRFKDEVKNAKKATKQSKGTTQPTNSAGDNTESEDCTASAASLQSDSAAGNEESQGVPCEMHWKNTRVDDTGKRIVIFDETGIFAVACRHGTVIFVEDMQRSGELAKYGLAAVNKLCEVFGDDILLGYDIGCTFCGTVHRSPLVGPIAEKYNICFCTGSFHGYAHNRKCQLKNHPMYLEGAGTESFEECETLFSSTNATASSTRHASRFHR
ncbi:hypothetical protein FRC08_001756 [Ceratobasidium sp. 394]|nr:hypothetical protein FRC08_001756 [Ceratobasidium sp. 394]